MPSPITQAALQGDANLQTSYSEEEVLALLVHGSPIRDEDVAAGFAGADVGLLD